MKGLNRLNTPCIDEFELIRISKHHQTRNNLLLLKPFVLSRYNEYDSKFDANNLEEIIEEIHSDNDKTDLLSCYINSTQALDNLVVRIKQNQDDNIKSICQYCGIGSDDSIDHYLPKEKFAEFCVKPLNLLPCCPRCNLLKKEYWLDQHINKRGILHLYLDVLPLVQYLFVSLEYDVNTNVFGATFYLDNINGIDDDLFSIITNHYRQLELCDRYKHRFNNIYSQTVACFDKISLFNNNPDLVKQFLINESDSLSEKFGINYYKAVIKRELSNNDIFLNQF